MKFSEKLTELRHSRGWSQEQLGERLGVTRQSPNGSLALLLRSLRS